MRSKIRFLNSNLSRGPKLHWRAAKRPADVKLAIAERDLAIDLHFTHLVGGPVFQRRQLLRKRSRARLIAARRHGHRQSFVRPDVIVAVAPLIKTNLHALEVGKDSLGQDFNFQAAMKAFVFALSLRMIRPTVTNGNAQAQKPNCQRRVLVLAIASPGRTIVHQHPLRQAIKAKSGGKLRLYGAGLLIAASLQAQRIARVIVEHGQRMTGLLTTQKIVTFKIHLPKLVRSLLFESLISATHLIRRVADALMAQQDRMHRAPGHWSLPSSLDAGLDLARAPAVLIANREHLLLNGRLASSRRMLWSARAIHQAAIATLSISLQPFVTSLAADTEPATQLTEIAFWLLRQGHKLLSQRHGRTLLPRHASLLKRFSCHCLMCYPCLWTPVTHVSGLYTPKGRGESINGAYPHIQTMTYNSFGPCTPMVSVNSISAVREGPVIKVIARLMPDCPLRRT